MGCFKVKHKDFDPLDNLVFHLKTSLSPTKCHGMTELVKVWWKDQSIEDST